MSTIICRRLTFGFDGTDQKLFTNLDLTIDTNWRSCVVGKNGRGKTSLLRLISGELSADSGSIGLPSAIRYFPSPINDPSLSAFIVAKQAAGHFCEWESEMKKLLNSGDNQALLRYSAMQVEFEEAGGYEIDAILKQELYTLGIGKAQLDMPFDQLSEGEQTRCLLASLFLDENSFVLIDEPTNHLDIDGRALLAKYLRSKRGFLLVSHDRDFLDSCVDHVIALNSDSVQVFRSNYSMWRLQHQNRLDSQMARHSQLEKEISALAATAKQRRYGAEKRESTKSGAFDKGFVGARAARQMKRALAAEQRIERSLEEKKASLMDIEKSYSLKLSTKIKRDNFLIRIDDLVVYRPGQLFESLSFSVMAGERLAIVGSNGCGKTSLLDVLNGRAIEFTGLIRYRPRVQVGRSYQRPKWQNGCLRARLTEAGLDESRFRQIMATLGVRGSVLDQPIERLSLGEQKKIDLARTFASPADILIWDEPLNYIDIETREKLEVLLLDSKPTVIFVEHDTAFIKRVATRTIKIVSYDF